MPTSNQIIQGLMILNKYAKSEYHVCADHDIIYAGPSSYDEVSSNVDVKELEHLGWEKDEGSGRWAVNV